MIDMEKCYGRREAAARESGNDALSYTYLRLGMIERSSKSGQLSEDMGRRCGCLVDEFGDLDV